MQRRLSKTNFFDLPLESNQILPEDAIRSSQPCLLWKLKASTTSIRTKVHENHQINWTGRNIIVNHGSKNGKWPVVRVACSSAVQRPTRLLRLRRHIMQWSIRVCVPYRACNTLQLTRIVWNMDCIQWQYLENREFSKYWRREQGLFGKKLAGLDLGPKWIYRWKLSRVCQWNVWISDENPVCSSTYTGMRLRVWFNSWAPIIDLSRS